MNKLLSASAVGGGGGGNSSNSISNPILGSLGQESGTSFFQKLIPAIISLALVIGTLVFFFMLITGAIQWISSGGDKQAVETARGKISNALIGLVVLFAIFAAIRLLNQFFGGGTFNLLNLTIPVISNSGGQ